ncbi:hypothetical protein AYR54_01880 [Loigolactobacillus backii]|uniref:helix-turn-helix domain-containing protein n=1 Tax=Loigolactobacillus TaxID=2767889 RepID=UPI0007F09482|nr:MULTISPECIES: helix-turn-helix domain-containing protein [Loigolactobacillus]ANK59124.1 hypothetical protein AYR52_01890 [Loigolactobacillus backii]ANK64113.1 hypothetical protein AYR54_01880 [Loigolactobacillus backii]ANK67493.1 hypothetical protein AYR55_07160 [Loigolactobacillus backii]OLF69644.1 hypothetical protein ACX53_06980 [Loigolactobacillus backii]PIO88217.1 helix-turn-helix domain-containing protein [Loigolactobacillus backii]
MTQKTDLEQQAFSCLAANPGIIYGALKAAGIYYWHSEFADYYQDSVLDYVTGFVDYYQSGSQLNRESYIYTHIIWANKNRRNNFSKQQNCCVSSELLQRTEKPDDMAEFTTKEASQFSDLIATIQADDHFNLLMTRLSENERYYLWRAYRADKNMVQIAKELGINRRSVYRIRDRVRRQAENLFSD